MVISIDSMLIKKQPSACLKTSSAVSWGSPPFPTTLQPSACNLACCLFCSASVNSRSLAAAGVKRSSSSLMREYSDIASESSSSPKYSC